MLSASSGETAMTFLALIVLVFGGPWLVGYILCEVA